MLTTAAPFDRLREQVETMMRTERSFQEVEREIDNTRLSEDRQAALWLVAWSLKRHDRE